MGVILSNKEIVEKAGITAVDESLRSAIDEALSSAPKIRKAAIINLINHIHFTDGTIRVHIRNKATGDEIIVPASPEPCVEDNFTARWMKHDGFNPLDYLLLNIIINNGKSIVLAPVKTVSITDDLFVATLPVKGHRWNRRQSRRYPANNDITVEIIQGNNKLKGVLKDFSSSDFCIKLDTGSSLSLNKFNTSKPILVQLSREKIIYSGYCSYIKTTIRKDDCLVVMKLVDTVKPTIKRENRNPRLKLVPAPKIVFNHPFSDNTIELEAADISSAGFAVKLSIDESPLMQALFIQELTIIINEGINLKCTASIVYQLQLDGKYIKYGFSILDMDMNVFNQLFAIACNAENPCVKLSPKIDLDSLWEFFFKSKFIYPKKYKLIESKSNEIKDVYNKLYHKGREIFTYITYQENGKIYGHCSIIRAYQRSWLIQHLAAISSENSNKVGIHVLYQVLNYLNTIFKLPSFIIDYLMFYYRPDNRFSKYFFGGLYKEANNPGIISQDKFAYLSYPLYFNENPMPNGFKIEETNNKDYETLNNFYQKKSGGGLLVKSLSIGMNLYEEPLEEIYNNIGLTRTCRIYSLKKYDRLKAVLIIDQADTGINMSELLNCIKVIIIDLDLPYEIMTSAINELGKIFYYDKVSVMIYPVEYLNLNNIVTERYYNLWIIDTKYGHEQINILKQTIDLDLLSFLI